MSQKPVIDVYVVGDFLVIVMALIIWLYFRVALPFTAAIIIEKGLLVVVIVFNSQNALYHTM